MTQPEEWAPDSQCDQTYKTPDKRVRIGVKSRDTRKTKLDLRQYKDGMSGYGIAKVISPEENFRLILEAAPDAMVVARRDGRIVLVNTQTEKLFGYPREELLGRKVETLLPHRVRRRHVKNRTDMESYGRHKDGTAFPVDVSLSPLEAGGEMLVSRSIRDITDRKRAEEPALHLASIVEASTDAIIAQSLDGTVTSWNSAAESLYGFKAEEVVGRPLSPLITEGRNEQLASMMKALCLGKQIEQLEITQLHRDGHPIELSLTISPVKDKAGGVVGASLIARDITGQKRAEAALRQSEERFRVALKNAPVVVFSQDLKLRYTWINSPVLAWGNQDYLGHTDAEIVGGEEGARLTAIKREVLRTGMGARAETQVTFQGETHHFDLVAEPLRDLRGTLLGLTCCATDITSIKNNLLEREDLVAKLREALEEVKRLSGLLSICASCKRITNERGDWEPLESYLQSHSQAKFTHGVCPECLRKLYPDFYPASEQEPPKT